MKIKKNRRKNILTEGQLISNTVFLMKYIYNQNKNLYFIRMPMILLQAISSFIPILFIRWIFNSYEGKAPITSILIIILLMAISILIVDIGIQVTGHFERIEVDKTRKKVNLHFGKSVMNLPYEDLEKNEIKNFIVLAQEDSIIYISTLVTNMILSIIKVIGVSAIIATVQPLIIVLLVIVIIGKSLINKKRREISFRSRNDLAPSIRKLDYLYDTMRILPFAKEIRVNNLSQWLYDKIADFTSNVVGPQKIKNLKKNKRLDSIIHILDISQELVIYLVLAFRVVFSGMSIGNFAMYMSGIGQFSNEVSNVSNNFSQLIGQGGFARELRYFVTTLQESESNTTRESDTNGVPLPEIQTAELEFANVSFSYPNSEITVLKNVSFKIRAGETLSIVGVNGAGKTTIVKLLCRFYEPTEGDILINGISIQSIPKDKYYQLLSVVFQDYKLFSFSVAENIEMKLQSNIERLETCIEKSGLGDIVCALPNGVCTYISKEFCENGVDFSGGEKQKIAIARALYKDSPIIILDEPTSAIDPIAEYEIYSKFHALVNGKTAIYISHRLSSTRFTDKILVLNDGRVAEYGSHKDLIALDHGIYKAMFEMQAKHYFEGGRHGEALGGAAD